MAVTVARRRMEATDICTFELVSAGDRSLPAFAAGAHVDVHVGHDFIRQYSLCNHPDERDRYVIAVLKDEKSRGGSLAMHELKEGDILQISEPKNHFPLAAGARRSVLFAGGIGITPILCMAERLAQIGASFELHYCARGKARMAFLERIQKSRFAAQAHLHFDDGPASQRLDVEAALVDIAPDTHVYVCGPGGFMSHVLGAAKRLGWPEQNVHREFFAAAVAVLTEADSGFDVKIASSGRVIRVDSEQTIAAALAGHGIEVPLSCEQGVCGTCLTRVLSGVPDHRDSFMTTDEHAKNDSITVCCSRSNSGLLVLDL
jgi:vanillate O-demethylase ferredoxin subunit